MGRGGPASTLLARRRPRIWPRTPRPWWPRGPACCTCTPGTAPGGRRWRGGRGGGRGRRPGRGGRLVVASVAGAEGGDGRRRAGHGGGDRGAAGGGGRRRAPAAARGG